MLGKLVAAVQVREIFGWRFLSVLVVLVVPVLIQACAPRQASRSSFPPPRIASPSRTQESQTRPSARSTPGRETPPLPDEGSLITKITPRTSPRRAASLRYTEEGKRLLESGEYARALARLEKTISIDSTNPYGYYYLGQTHYHMGHFQQSLNFLDVAESLLASQPYWLAEVFALKGENFRALGFFQRAESSYFGALRLNPRNRVAAEGLSRMRGKMQPSLR